uniref:Uncharacterized protein n=1 Tax=Arundo donax TaxID=35708 RepID=A0A0A9GZG7_ARUDO
MMQVMNGLFWIRR